jgi:uncharacterized protein YebE (UPF0316 family)
MSLLSASLFFVIGLISWYLALRRTLACVKGQRRLVSALVFCEELIGFVVMYFLVVDKNWLGAIFYAVGGALGAYLVNNNKDSKKPAEENTSSAPSKP